VKLSIETGLTGLTVEEGEVRRAWWRCGWRSYGENRMTRAEG
jgi:hypothetical protein